MDPVLHNAALGLAVAAVGGASLRVAGRVLPGGLERIVAAAPLAGVAVVGESLLLGLFGAGTSTVALLIAALATWGGAVIWLPLPEPGLVTELARWWRTRPVLERVAIAAGCGLLAAMTVWMLRHPDVGDDGSGYHLPEILEWIRDGHPGSLHPTIPFLPVENYPLTDEVALGWVLSLSRGFAAIAIYQVAMALLLGAASLVGLRALDVPRVPRLLATATLVTLPLVVQQLNGPYTDLPMLAWLVAGAALCALSPAYPGAFGLALAAFGLSVGTKTTAAPAAVLVLVATLVLGRPRVSLRVVLAGLAAACLAGGIWYARNLIDHGWPLWPFTRGPWGDPLPRFMTYFDTPFLDHPVDTVRLAPEVYRQAVAGLLVLFPAALVLAALRRRRDVLLATAGALVLAVVWAVSPFTGRPTDPIFEAAAVSTSRYMMPALAAGVLAVAVAARPPGRLAGAVTALLALALGVNVSQLVDLGYPYLPSAATLLVGALAGVIVWGAASLAWRWLGGRPPSRLRLLAPALVVVAAVALTPAASGFMRRHADRDLRGQRELILWFADRPGFTDGTRAVDAYPSQVGVLAGDRLRHPVRLLRARGCAALRRRAAQAWIVTYPVPTIHNPIVDAVSRRATALERCLNGPYGPRFVSSGWRVYGPPS